MLAVLLCARHGNQHPWIALEVEQLRVELHLEVRRRHLLCIDDEVFDFADAPSIGADHGPAAWIDMVPLHLVATQA